MDSLADRAPRRGRRAAHRSGIHGGRSGPARLSPRQPPARTPAARLRLFVAVNFPLQVRQDLWQATAPLRDRGLPVKWVRWVGIRAEPALESLQHQVEREFAALGFPTEARAFCPHVTLGRTAREARPRDFTGLEAALERLRYDASVVVDALDLMQSTLQSGGAVYNVRHSERLP